MFETDNFTKQLESTISAEVVNSGLKGLEPAIIRYLQGLASGNEKILMERELRKTATERRGLADALRNARNLTREASAYAKTKGRTVLAFSDVEATYKAKFCQFWPFCKSNE